MAGECFPLIGIGNYLFDSLKQDAFTVLPESGDLEEWKVNIVSPLRTDDENFISSVIGTSAMEWSRDFVQNLDESRASEDGPYVFESYLNQILQRYQRDCQASGASFVLPVGSLRLIEQLRLFSEGELLIIAGDKAHSYARELDEFNEPPDIVSHEGCFSFTANFDAISKYFELHRGLTYHLNTETRFRVSIFVSQSAEGGTNALTRSQFPALTAAADSLDHFGPENYFSIYEGASWMGKYYKEIQKKASPLQRERAFQEHLSLILSHLRLSCYDIDLFWAYHKAILACLTNLPEHNHEHEMVQRVLYRIWSQCYFLPGCSSVDVPFSLGEMFQSMELPGPAAKFFEYSVARFPDDPVAALYNLGVCYMETTRLAEALQCFERCSTISDDEDIQEKILLLQQQLAPQTPALVAPRPVPTRDLFMRGMSISQEDFASDGATQLMNTRNKAKYA